MKECGCWNKICHSNLLSYQVKTRIITTVAMIHTRSVNSTLYPLSLYAVACLRACKTEFKDSVQLTRTSKTFNSVAKKVAFIYSLVGVLDKACE